MESLVYFICKNCGVAVDSEDYTKSYLPLRLCSECKLKHFQSLVENKIWNTDKQTLEYLQMFFSDKDTFEKYGWNKKQASEFISLIKQRLNDIKPLSFILTMGGLDE